MVDLKFQDEALEAIEKETQNKFVSYPQQRKMMAKMNRAIREFVPVKGPVARGCVTLGVLAWQIAHDAPFAEVLEMPIADRLDAAREVYQTATDRLAGALAGADQKPVLEQALKDAFKYYAENFAAE